MNSPQDLQAQGLALLDQPAFEIKHGPAGPGGLPVRAWIEPLTPAGPDRHPAGTKLYVKAVAPTVQGATDILNDEKPGAWAVMIMRLDGNPYFYLEPTQERAQSRLDHWKDREVISKQMKPVRVHGLTARAFDEAQHYRASSKAFAQNAMDLQARIKKHVAREHATSLKLDAITKAVLALSLVSGGLHPELWRQVHEALALSTEPVE
ncbi:hypothetical protein [Pseudomonas sp. CFBP 13719]|uniref:hypothetical protein n=1 Tax=Pseudomonas sp. CFBP 13719 TaxID=2775303 RepID=UPI00177C4552|nr:hypothetical protein [Pseudomonas sp. CFBP 13719]MBD8615408.1 hypothetical protein [Pseudomonas putida]MBD8681939.1 hypothetical protein [Pseudomonas sp. CFBP 13719]